MDRLNCQRDLDFEEQGRFTACVSEFCQHPPDVKGLVQQPLHKTGTQQMNSIILYNKSMLLVLDLACDSHASCGFTDSDYF
jgi:hypothetical protein